MKSQLARVRLKSPWASKVKLPNHSRHATYFPEIDGLRGLSVLLVFAFHLDLPFLRGGYLGVDAFFVISGYLITSIILQDVSKDRFKYSEFILRRAKRLLPALGIMVFATTFIAWLLLGSGELSRFADSLFGVATYTSNFIFLLDEGYFKQSAATTPLLHTWSLSVEEQFYLLFPLLILIFYSKKSLGNLQKAIFALTALSLLLWIVSREAFSVPILLNGSFYLLPTRAWELGAGCLLAIQIAQGNATAGSKNLKPNFLALSGALIFLISLGLGSEYPDHGFPSIALVISMCLLISAAAKSKIGKFLRAPILVQIGLLSYGIYLYHFPLIALVKIVEGSESLSLGGLSFVVVTTTMLSVLSLRFVENPLRYNNARLSTSLLATSVFVLSILGLGAISKVPAQEISQESKTAEVLQDNEWAYFTNMDERVFQIERLKRADAVNGEKTVVGSSRAMSVNSDMVGTPILNISVSGSSIEDLYTLGLSGVKVSKGSSILIGLDPWIINRNYEDNRWQSLRDEYVYWSSVVDNQLPLSSSQFFAADDKVARASLITKLYQEINIAKYSTIPRNGLPETVAKKSKEGSIIYGLEYATMSEREKRAGFPADLRYGGMAQFEVSQRNLVKIEKLIKYLQSNGIEVTLLLSPYHPDLFSDSAIQLRSINLAETSFRDMANETSAILLGSFDPKILKCEASEFYDGMHPKESCMRKTLEHQKVQRK